MVTLDTAASLKNAVVEHPRKWDYMRVLADAMEENGDHNHIGWRVMADWRRWPAEPKDYCYWHEMDDFKEMDFQENHSHWVWPNVFKMIYAKYDPPYMINFFGPNRTLLALEMLATCITDAWRDGWRTPEIA